jgi:hypothetical protein
MDRSRHGVEMEARPSSPDRRISTMTHVPHELADDLPDHKERIHALKTTDPQMLQG